MSATHCPKCGHEVKSSKPQEERLVEKLALIIAAQASELAELKKNCQKTPDAT